MMKTLAFWGETKAIRFYQWGFVFCKESSKYQASLSHGNKQASKILGKGMWARAPPLSLLAAAALYPVFFEVFILLHCHCMVCSTAAAAHHNFAKGVMGLNSEKKHRHIQFSYRTLSSFFCFKI